MTTATAEQAATITPAFLRPEGAAQYLSISTRHLYDLPIPKAKVGRKCTLYARSDLDSFVASLTRGRK